MRERERMVYNLEMEIGRTLDKMTKTSLIDEKEGYLSKEYVDLHRKMNTLIKSSENIFKSDHYDVSIEEYIDNVVLAVQRELGIEDVSIESIMDFYPNEIEEAIEFCIQNNDLEEEEEIF